jgi:hypothetical protein
VKIQPKETIMDIDLAYRIELTPLSPRKYLYPLFEAIANSMQSIQEAREAKGEIIIHIKRDTSQQAVAEDVVPLQPIIGFTIEDNGAGFTDDNLLSFKKVHSSRKRKLGGKGVGRLLWLKAFQKAEVDSVYQANGKVKRRTFEFSIPHNGVGDEKAPEVNGHPKRTSVHLIKFLAPYADKCTANTDLLGKKIIGHFLGYFILGTGPTIILKDEYENTEINLNTEFRLKMQMDSKQTKLKIREHEFQLQHLCLATTSEKAHEVLFCSQGRVVETEDLQNHIPSLRNALRGKDERPFYYNVIVNSKLFRGGGGGLGTHTTEHLRPKRMFFQARTKLPVKNCAKRWRNRLISS